MGHRPGKCQRRETEGRGSTGKGPKSNALSFIPGVARVPNRTPEHIRQNEDS